MLKIIHIESDKYLDDVRNLFREYAASLDFDLSFQDFEKELRELPNQYISPYGCILLALYEGKTSGCVALRKIDDTICEMKRLYVKSDFRGKSIGRNLAIAIIEEARKFGYKCMRLDTLASMEKARLLYYSLGFMEIEPYCYNPIEGAIFMELILS